MTTNGEAAEAVRDAIMKLILVYDGASGKQERARITAVLTKLKAEYDALKHRKPATTYAEITGGISSSANRLEVIRKEREALKNSFVSAAEILSVVTRVLGLLQG
ncbi:hypothetical protein OCK02_09850 [Rhizobium sp. TRM96647]|uniref:hypothetical protein n=1 Tax=unclassified Rhizobium TaxID=2613769 RepID=UPI0021E8B00D|nr:MULTISPECIES: hypothetical protein [unclassified Rhizobium]MCV3736506.1 hypothetical protein [Rhizobium sp. TRM96647]MCV3758875.1 hypothetical protein [Rhizobium sp. TRM96650]